MTVRTSNVTSSGFERTPLPGALNPERVDGRIDIAGRDMDTNRPYSSGVEHSTCNAGVRGSNPRGGNRLHDGSRLHDGQFLSMASPWWDGPVGAAAEAVHVLSRRRIVLSMESCEIGCATVPHARAVCQSLLCCFGSCRCCRCRRCDACLGSHNSHLCKCGHTRLL